MRYFWSGFSVICVLVILTAIVIASCSWSLLRSTSRKRNKNRAESLALSYYMWCRCLSCCRHILPLCSAPFITEIYNFSNFLSTYIPNSPFLNYFQNDAFSGAKDIVANLSHSLSLTTLLDTSKAFITNLSGGFFQTLSAAFVKYCKRGLDYIPAPFFIWAVQEKGISRTFYALLLFLHSMRNYAVDLWGPFQSQDSAVGQGTKATRCIDRCFDILGFVASWC